MRLLCIEDEKPLREDIVEYLRAQSYVVDEAGCGEEGLKCLASSNYDAVLCDIKMPRMDGFDVLRRMRADNDATTTPFIFLSALTERDDRVRAHHWGCDVYLTKPIDFAVLDATLKSQVERQRAQTYLVNSARESFRSHIMTAIEDTLRQPIASLVRVTDYLIEQSPTMAPERLHSYLKQIQTGLGEQSQMMETVLNTLALQVDARPVMNGAILAEDLLESVAHHVCGASVASLVEIRVGEVNEDHLVRGDVHLLNRTLLGLLRVAQPMASGRVLLEYTQAGNHYRLTVADHGSIPKAAGGDFFRLEEHMDLANLSSVTRQRLIPLLYAEEVARLHGGYIELKLWEDHWLAVQLVLPKPIVADNEKNPSPGGE